MKLPRRHHLNRALGKSKKSDPIDMQALVMHQISFFAWLLKSNKPIRIENTRIELQWNERNGSS